jgi:F0F1-type ATP synthase membrane subunit c/vacuolar-type H+-ATPase subunit K
MQKDKKTSVVVVTGLISALVMLAFVVIFALVTR